MRALLLAAGEGTRLRPLTQTIPKCLVEIGQKPLLQHWLDDLERSIFFDEVMINTHYLAESVEKFLAGYTSTTRIQTSYEPQLLGPGGTILKHREWLSQSDFLVAHADNFSQIDWPAFIEAHHSRPAGCVGTMMTFVTDDPTSCGIVETDDRGVLRKMHEKVVEPPGHVANAAVFLFSPHFFEVVSDINSHDVIDISRHMIPRLLGRLATFATSGYHRDIGTPESLSQARRDYTDLSPPMHS